MSEQESGGVDHPEDGTEQWEFDKGETLVKEDASEPTMPGLEGIEPQKTECTVKRRLVDPDDERQMYYLEWEEDAPDSPRTDRKIKNMLYSASLVSLHYRSVETDTERGDSHAK